MKSFIIDRDLRPIRKTDNFKRFLTDFRINGRVELDEYTEFYYIRKIKLLNDPYSMYELLKAHILFIMVVAKQMHTSGVSFEDLVSEGCFGFIKAAHRFEDKKGCRFLSYAVWYIKAFMMKSLADNNELIRIPQNHYNILRKVNIAIDYFFKKNGHSCFPEYIADKMDLPSDYVQSLLTIPKGSMIVSFNDTYESYINPDTLEEHTISIEEAYLFDEYGCAYDDGLRLESLRYELNRSLSTLTERESEIVRLFFGIGLIIKNGLVVENEYCDEGATLEEIGDVFGLVRERVRQIKEKAIKRLRHTSRSKLLRGYLG